MEKSVILEGIYVPSEEIVAREIEGELIIVPLTAGIGNMEDELYSLNATGRDIWGRLDGVRNLKAIASELAAQYNAPPATIEGDVLGLMEELLKRKMVVAVP